MKKLLTIVSLCLAIVMTLPLVASAAAGELPFTDVKAGKWYYGNVKYVYENGIMNGVTDTKFDPTGTLTRGMCATIIYRMAGSPKTEAENKFTDVKTGKYYTKAIVWARDVRVVNGKSPTVFDPDTAITRAEFATMMANYVYAMDLDLKETRTTDPADFEKTPQSARDAVTMLYRSRVVNGRQNGEFDPKASITRAEVAAIIERFNNAAVPYVHEDDGVLDVVFIGCSFTYVPETFNHFEALAEGKHPVKTHNETVGATGLDGHYKRWKMFINFPSEKKKIRQWDVVVLEDAVNGPYLGLEEEYKREYEFFSSNNPGFVYNSLDEYYADIVSKGCVTWKNYTNIVELFGKDKVYYNLCPSNIMKNEKSGGAIIKVEEFSEDGLWRHVFIRQDPEVINQHWERSNYDEFIGRDWLKQNCDINRIMLNLDTFDPDKPPSDPSEFYLWPEDYHPNLMYGYCHALALYCTIYDEPCAEQNNGILTDEDIPGDTPEEKAAYMVMIKNLVQEQLDFQNAH